MTADKQQIQTNMVFRKSCVICEGRELEQLFVLERFPILMCSTEASKETDRFVDMIWYICKDCGCIQLDPVIPMEVLYQQSHASMVGEVWENFYSEFSKFMSKYAPRRIFEIGGAHGKLSLAYKKIVPDCQWTMLEPDPLPIEGLDAQVIKGYFDDKFEHTWSYDACIHTHVFEHIHFPLSFMNKVSNIIPDEGMMIFAIPNMLPQLNNYFLSCLDNEHTFFLSENYVEYLMQKYGFEIIEKRYYLDDHSIFYAAKRKYGIKCINRPNDTNKIKYIFNRYIAHYLDEVDRLNKLMAIASGEIYLFGAHIFSQYLIAFGLDTARIVSILDNSPIKQEKRLYGTNFMVYSPKILKNKGKAHVILKAGMYNQEIMDDILKNINPKVEFWL